MFELSRDHACIGLDIGGANLKLFHTDAIAHSVPFAMWKHPEMLAQRLIEAVSTLPPASTWLITMTGELADCFEDRATGVRYIVEQVQRAARQRTVRKVLYYAIPNDSGAAGGFTLPAYFIDAVTAGLRPGRVASANWHATAQHLANQSPRPGTSIVVDIGSTTTDMIPIREGKVVTNSQTDFDRLAAGELVYIGGERTPVCSLVNELPWHGRMIPIMREFFADIGDCACLLGIAETRDEFDATQESKLTADGRPRTVAHARTRMARMIGRDGDQVEAVDACEMAQYVVDQAAQIIHRTLNALDPSGSRPLILLGHHRWLLSGKLRTDRIFTDACDSPMISRVGPAYALCQLFQLQQTNSR